MVREYLQVSYSRRTLTFTMASSGSMILSNRDQLRVLLANGQLGMHLLRDRNRFHPYVVSTLR